MDIDHRFYSWGGDSWPGALERWDADNGRIPMISLGGRSSFPGLDAIADGAQDSYLAALADRVRAFGDRLFLRPLWEMNGDWSAWGGAANNDGGQANGPAKYIRAWRHMHNIFAERGATNAVWVWSPNCIDKPADAWNHWTGYYPGDAYVDWVACDGYNWGTTMPYSEWRSWATIFGGPESVYADYATKPFMVAETASCEQGGDKAAWLRDAEQFIAPSFPNVRAFVYFDAFSEQEVACDWRVTSSQAALDAFRTLAADPYFHGRGPQG
jgi:beta-mannanase